jgi:hypothetical protein
MKRFRTEEEIRMTRKAALGFPVGAISFGLLLAALVPGCGDDDGGADASWPAGSTGIRGHVRCDGTSVVTEVGASALVDEAAGGESWSDETGYFEFEVTPGVYRVSTYYYGSWCLDGYGEVEPVVVSGGVWVDIDIDCRCGVVE